MYSEETINDYIINKKYKIINKFIDNTIVEFDDKIRICINDLDSIEEIKNKYCRQVSNVNTTINFNNCPICRDRILIQPVTTFFTCPRCVNLCCTICYYKLISPETKIITCPYCKYTSKIIKDN